MRMHSHFNIHLSIEDEIRLIIFIPQPTEPDLVRCALETASLNSLTSEYQHYDLASRLLADNLDFKHH